MAIIEEKVVEEETYVDLEGMLFWKATRNKEVNVVKEMRGGIV